MAMLGLTDILRRKDALPEIVEPAEPVPTFEADLESAFDLDAMAEELAGQVDQGDDAVDEMVDPAETVDIVGDVPTAHAQALLASFSVFEEANNSTRDELAVIGKAFTSIVTNFNLGRDFLDSCRQEILRASELEQSNNRLATQNRRLADRSEKVENLCERLNDQLDSVKRREARLVQETDSLRMLVSDLRLELVELRNSVASAEHGRSEMHQSLAAKNADVERLTRECEVLREKSASLTTEMDLAHRRQTEMRLRFEETQSAQSLDAAHLSEIAGKLSTAEKEVLRLQKQLDAAEAQQREGALSLQNAEHDVWERDRRHQAETQALRNEIAQLQLRLSRPAAMIAAASDDETAMPAMPLRKSPPKLPPAASVS